MLKMPKKFFKINPTGVYPLLLTLKLMNFIMLIMSFFMSLLSLLKLISGLKVNKCFLLKSYRIENLHLMSTQPCRRKGLIQ